MSGRFKKLKGILQQTILVIGSGVIGLATAVALAREGIVVTLLERGALDQGCSWVAGGILSALPPWAYAPPVTALMAESRRVYPAWLEDLMATTGVDPEYLERGMMIMPPYDASAACAFATANQVKYSTVLVRDIEPALAPDVTGLWMPNVAQVRSNRLLKSLRKAADMLGVAIVEQAEIISLAISSSRVNGAFSRKQTYPAEAVILTTGAWSNQLLGSRALSLDIRPMRGQILLFKGAPQTRPIILRDGFYLITRADGHILAGSTLEDVGFDAMPTVVAKNRLYAKAMELLPELKAAPVIAQWAGLRPGSPGNIPTISAHPYIDNLYLNAGHFRYGITMAPASAEIIVNYILERPQTLDVTPYRWPN